MNADLLMGPGEVVGCGQRHKTASEVLEALARHSVESEPYEWYIGLKSEFPLQTTGFGLGVERFLLWLTGHDDIRDLQIVPRDHGRAMAF